MSRQVSNRSSRRLGLALEYALGHVTHAENLKQILADRPGMVPHYVDIPYDAVPGAWARLPGFRSNWTLRASTAAFLGLRKVAPSCAGLLFHTQVTSVFSTGLMRRTPGVVSLDATPLQYDSQGAFYGHAVGSGPLETLKYRLNRNAFHAARSLVTWSEWAKRSLVNDYGVPADRVEVIPPGIDVGRWDFGDRHAKGTVNLLFVGGDFSRKGGDILLQAWGLLPATVRSRCVLHLVTPAPGVGDGVEGVVVHRGLRPNTPELLRLFREADLFVFPTLGDCLPLAILEALASGLPIVTTSVGALAEAVVDGRSGRVVPAGDPVALGRAIEEAVTDPAQRLQWGRAARDEALSRFDARCNYGRLADIVAGVAPVSSRRAA
ncbi:MAG: glycosyltransferase family 4 protein [Armatimonadaceae bacterium]